MVGLGRAVGCRLSSCAVSKPKQRGAQCTRGDAWSRSGTDPPGDLRAGHRFGCAGYVPHCRAASREPAVGSWAHPRVRHAARAWGGRCMRCSKHPGTVVSRRTAEQRGHDQCSRSPGLLPAPKCARLGSLRDPRARAAVSHLVPWASESAQSPRTGSSPRLGQAARRAAQARNQAMSGSPPETEAPKHTFGTQPTVLPVPLSRSAAPRRSAQPRACNSASAGTTLLKRGRTSISMLCRFPSPGKLMVLVCPVAGLARRPKVSPNPRPGTCLRQQQAYEKLGFGEQPLRTRGLALGGSLGSADLCRLGIVSAHRSRCCRCRHAGRWAASFGAVAGRLGSPTLATWPGSIARHPPHRRLAGKIGPSVASCQRAGGGAPPCAARVLARQMVSAAGRAWAGRSGAGRDRSPIDKDGGPEAPCVMQHDPQYLRSSWYMARAVVLQFSRTCAPAANPTTSLHRAGRCRCQRARVSGCT